MKLSSSTERPDNSRSKDEPSCCHKGEVDGVIGRVDAGMALRKRRGENLDGTKSIASSAVLMIPIESGSTCN